MTLLLKNVWRNTLRVSLSRAAWSRSVTSSLEEVRPKIPPDSVMTSLKAAPNADVVLATVQSHLPIMTYKHMLQALRCLFELQKAGKMQQDPQHIVKNPAFNVLCQNFKKHARALEVNEVIEAIKVLSYLQVPVDSLIVQTMLQLVRYSINSLNVRQIIFLDFLLSRYDTKNHLVDALKLAFPLVFQIRMPLELDNDDLPLLRDMLSYSCAHDLPDRCVNNVVTALLLHRGLDATSARAVLWALCRVNCTRELFPTRAQLLHLACDTLAQNVHLLSYDEVLRTAAKLKGRIVEKHPEFYHEGLLDALAGYVVHNRVDFEQGLLVARVLSRIAHTNLALVQYLCEVAASRPTTLSAARANILFAFVNCLANADYTPATDQWREIKRQISTNPILETQNHALPWTKFCLELASLGHYEDRVLARVFSEQFLREYLLRDDNTLDHLQLLTLHEAVRTFHSEEYQLPQETLEKARSLYPVHSSTDMMEEALARGLGGAEYVAKNVVLHNGIVVDLLVCLKNGDPIKLTKPANLQRIPIDRLNIPEDAITVCLLNFNQGCFSMNSNRLRGSFRLVVGVVEAAVEASGRAAAAAPLPAGAGRAAPGGGRAAVLAREVAAKARERQLDTPRMWT